MNNSALLHVLKELYSQQINVSKVIDDKYFLLLCIYTKLKIYEKKEKQP